MRRRQSWKSYFNRKSRRVWAGVLIFLFIFGYFFALRPFFRIKVKAAEITAAGRELKAAFAKNDIDLVKKELDELDKKYQELEN